MSKSNSFKILFISHKHPPSTGGMEVQNYELLKGIQDRFEIVPLILQPSMNKWKYYATLSSTVKKMLTNDSEIKLIYLNDGLMAAILAHLPSVQSIPVVATFHGLDLIFPNKWYQNRLQKFAASGGHAICVSQATYNKAIESHFTNSNAVIHINNGIAPTENDNQKIRHDKVTLSKLLDTVYDANNIFLYSLGRAVPRKGFSWFISNVMPLLPEHVKYIVVGPNNVSKTLSKLLNWMPKSLSIKIATLMGFTTDYAKALEAVKELGLHNRVFVQGYLPSEKLELIKSQADIFIMPNVPFPGDMEGFGLVILEANLSHKWVIASGIEGITSAVSHGDNATVLPALKAKEWVHAILQLIENRPLLKEKGITSAAWVKEHYSWDKMSKEYADYFLKISAR